MDLGRFENNLHNFLLKVFGCKEYGVRSFTCDSQLLTSFNNYSQVSTKIYNTCGFLWIIVNSCDYLWLLVNTCETILVSCEPRSKELLLQFDWKTLVFNYYDGLLDNFQLAVMMKDAISTFSYNLINFTAYWCLVIVFCIIGFMENKIDMQIHIVMLSIIRSIFENKILETDAEYEF